MPAVESPSPSFVAGRPCLDLLATLGDRFGLPIERLRKPADVATWLVRSGVLADPPKTWPSDVDHYRSLRDAFDRIVRARLRHRGPDAADLAEVNRWAAIRPLAPVLAADGSVAWTADRPVEAALATVARDAVRLLASPDADRIKQCSSPTCSLLFVDTSRAGARRWCSMDACGNRSKVASYRRRGGA